MRIVNKRLPAAELWIFVRNIGAQACSTPGACRRRCSDMMEPWLGRTQRPVDGAVFGAYASVGGCQSGSGTEWLW